MGENSRVMHFGRSFHDTRLEDDCPCEKAPCGLVSDDRVNPDCLQHPWGRVKTIRQRHWADDCPAKVVLALANSGLTPRQIRAVFKFIESESTWR